MQSKMPGVAPTCTWVIAAQPCVKVVGACKDMDPTLTKWVGAKTSIPHDEQYECSRLHADTVASSSDCPAVTGQSNVGGPKRSTYLRKPIDHGPMTLSTTSQCSQHILSSSCANAAPQQNKYGINIWAVRQLMLLAHNHLKASVSNAKAPRERDTSS